MTERGALSLVRTAGADSSGMADRCDQADRRRRPVGRRLRTAGAAIGLGALVVGILPAIAVADSAATAVIYYGRVSNSTGTMMIVAQPTVCPTGQYEISWNKVGPQDKQGTAGPQGPAGPTAPQGPAGVASAVTSYSGVDVVLSDSTSRRSGFCRC